MISVILVLCCLFFSVFLGIMFVIIKSKKLLTEYIFKIKSLTEQEEVLIDWISINNKSEKLQNYFLEQRIKKIYIYGYTKMAEILISEFEKIDVEIEAVIDKRAEYIYSSKKIINLENDISNADIIINTVLNQHNEIVNDLKNKNFNNVISHKEFIRYIK